MFTPLHVDFRFWLLPRPSQSHGFQGIFWIDLTEAGQGPGASGYSLLGFKGQLACKFFLRDNWEVEGLVRLGQAEV